MGVDEGNNLLYTSIFIVMDDVERYVLRVLTRQVQFIVVVAVTTRMFPRTGLSCQIVWGTSGGRTCLMVCTSTSTAVVHQEVVRTECFCEPSPSGITVSWGTR